MRTYLFYDTETTGLNPAFDQIVQFAAIRTDEALNELERHEFAIRLRPDVIPTPAALITHRLPVLEAAEDLREYDGVRRISALVNAPGTISIGYNSLGFDDLFLRFSFYRNLLPPYTHQYADACGRADLFPMAVLYWLYRPEMLRWPKKGDGQLSLKLEDLITANQLVEGRAHNALVDVAATVNMARLLAADAPMWRFCLSCFDRDTDRRRQDALESREIGGHAYPLALLVGGRFRHRYLFQAPALGLGRSHVYRNQTLWLRLDSSAIHTLTPETVSAAPVERSRDGDLPLVLPLEKATFNSTRQRRVADNLAWLAERPQLLARLAQNFQTRTHEAQENVDVDAALYNVGFFTLEEQATAQAFHAAAVAEKAMVIAHFPTPHTRLLAARIMARNFGVGTEAGDYQRFLARINGRPGLQPLLDFQGRPRLTPGAAREQIGGLLRSRRRLDAEQRAILNHLETYLARYFPEPE